MRNMLQAKAVNLRVACAHLIAAPERVVLLLPSLQEASVIARDAIKIGHWTLHIGLRGLVGLRERGAPCVGDAVIRNTAKPQIHSRKTATNKGWRAPQIRVRTGQAMGARVGNSLQFFARCFA